MLPKIQESTARPEHSHSQIKKQAFFYRIFILKVSFSIIRYMLQTQSLTHKCLAFSSLTPLFVDRFGRSLGFCHPEVDKEAISDGFMAHSRVFRMG